MPDRWIALCRRLAPPALRDEAFDPSVEDLVQAACERPATAGRLPRLAAGLRLRGRVLIVALQCRRLAPAAIVPVPSRAFLTRGAMIRELTVVARRLWREPRFTAAVVLTVALGLGANLTVFTFVDAFLIAPLPVPAPEALVRAGEARENGEVDITSYLNYRDGRDAVRPALDLAAHAETMALVGPAEASEARPVEVVSGNYFRVLGAAPQRGRLLSEADDRTELAHPVAVVSDRYWRSRLGGRTDVVGQPVFINGSRFEIVGVTAPGFNGTYAARHIDLWAPVTMQQVVRPRGLTLDRRTWGWLSMIGRMAPGTTIIEAERALSRAADAINQRFPPGAGAAPFAFRVRPATALADADRRTLAAPLLTIFAFTAVLFLATCANLAGLMHARLAARRRELAIRQSLGAGRLRLMREWMLECVALALCGGVAALLLARLTAIALTRIELPLQVMGPFSFATTLEWRVVAYAVAASVAGALLFGATSAWRSGRQAPADVLKAEGGTSAGGRRSARGRRVTVAFQVGVSVVLLMLASLLTVSLHRQEVAAPGFAGTDLGLMSIDLRRRGVPEAEWPALTRRVVDAARAMPGVALADIGFRAPLSPGEDVVIIRVPGYDPAHDATGLQIDFNQVGPQYFQTLGIPFVGGTTWDAGAGAPSVVINATMASRYWPGTDAVGKTVLIGRAPATVAGVVADTVYYNVGEAVRPYIYLPAHVQPPGRFVLHLRAAGNGDPGALAAAVAAQLGAIDQRVGPFDVMSFDDLRRVPLFPARMLAMAALIFGAVSLLLTIVGLYGVIAASVGARTREIGVRLALGATPDRVQRGVIGDALRVAAVGGAAGLAGAYLAARQLRGWLYTVEPFDPVLAFAVVALIALVAVLSAWMPARRASRVDPVAVLK